MRFRHRRDGPKAEMDMTPMIDMAFQLIAFFMFAISFSQNEQDERVMLPDSVLAKPANQPLKHPVTLHLTRTGNVIYGGQELPALERLRPYLVNERMVLQGRNRTMEDATVVIRADRLARAGVVQKLIQMCQEEKFEKFALRAQEDIGP
ncbi:MAG: biopolymer transporter ExbD [Planctomycetaceae bacterium]|nr:biopolymer transporter ExbD [Planctomycetaceae bacterium]